MRNINIMCGLPGSGKTTFCKKQKGIVLSRDDFVKKHFSGPSYDPDYVPPMKKEAYSMWWGYVREMMREHYKEDFWIDQPTINIKSLKGFLQKTQMSMVDNIHLWVLTTDSSLARSRRPLISQKDFYEWGTNPLIKDYELVMLDRPIIYHLIDGNGYEIREERVRCTPISQ